MQQPPWPKHGTLLARQTRHCCHRRLRLLLCCHRRRYRCALESGFDCVRNNAIVFLGRLPDCRSGFGSGSGYDRAASDVYRCRDGHWLYR